MGAGGKAGLDRPAAVRFQVPLRQAEEEPALLAAAMPAWTPLLALHVAGAAVAVPLGAWNLLRRTRGDRVHRRIGYAWAALMAWVAISSFWIRELNDGSLSGIHVLSAVTLVTLTLGIVAGVRRRPRLHRGMMTGSYVGLLIAGALAAVVPVRALPTLAREQTGVFLLGLLAVAVVAAAILAAAHWPGGRRPGPAASEAEP
jgi:uncharacterized membrane protein